MYEDYDYKIDEWYGGIDLYRKDDERYGWEWSYHIFYTRSLCHDCRYNGRGKVMHSCVDISGCDNCGAKLSAFWGNYLLLSV